MPTCEFTTPSHVGDCEAEAVRDGYCEFHSAFDPYPESGECDTCGKWYALADALDHCTECGNCLECCACVSV